MSATYDERIGIVGSGGFGTVLAKMLAENGTHVRQWVRNGKQADEMRATRENRRYLPNVEVPDSVQIVTDVKEVVGDATIVVSAVPSFAARDVARQYAPHIAPGATVLNLAKGIEHDTFLRMSQVIEQEVPEGTFVASLSGPNLAEELAKRMPAGAIVASTTPECLPRLVRALRTDFFKVYPLQDIVGVELGGVLKNISALAAGISDGIGFGENSKASLITLGLYEMFVVGAKMGAKRQTFYGLSGIGDLVATCSSRLSRNHTVGELLGKGKTLDEAIEALQGRVAEGVNATKFVHELGRLEGLKLPMTDQMHHVLYEGKDVRKGIEDLLQNV